MNPKDVGSLGQGEGMEYCGAVEGCVGCGIEQLVNHTFMRYAHQDGQLKDIERYQVIEQLAVLIKRLVESNA